MNLIGTTVFIVNLSKEIREQEIEDEFVIYGKIISVDVVRDPISRYVKHPSLPTSTLQATMKFKLFKSHRY